MDWHFGGGYDPTHLDEANIVRFSWASDLNIGGSTQGPRSSTAPAKYHLVWITKYRVPVLGGDVGQRAREVLREIARAHEMTICAGAINRDHVHMLIGIPPHLSVSRAVQYLKGKSSHKLLEEYQSLRKRYWSSAGQHLWGRGHWVATSGNITDEVWQKCIEDQKPEIPDDHFSVV